MSAETFPAGPTPADELARIGATFPRRDGRGYVTGYYVYDGAARVAGPLGTLKDAERAAAARKTLGVVRVIAGHVFTSRGTIVGPDAPACTCDFPDVAHALGCPWRADA